MDVVVNRALLVPAVALAAWTFVRCVAWDFHSTLSSSYNTLTMLPFTLTTSP